MVLCRCLVDPLGVRLFLKNCNPQQEISLRTKLRTPVASAQRRRSSHQTSDKGRGLL